MLSETRSSSFTVATSVAQPSWKRSEPLHRSARSAAILEPRDGPLAGSRIAGKHCMEREPRWGQPCFASVLLYPQETSDLRKGLFDAREPH